MTVQVFAEKFIGWSAANGVASTPDLVRSDAPRPQGVEQPLYIQWRRPSGTMMQQGANSMQTDEDPIEHLEEVLRFYGMRTTPNVTWANYLNPPPPVVPPAPPSIIGPPVSAEEVARAVSWGTITAGKSYFKLGDSNVPEGATVTVNGVRYLAVCPRFMLIWWMKI